MSTEHPSYEGQRYNGVGFSIYVSNTAHNGEMGGSSYCTNRLLDFSISNNKGGQLSYLDYHHRSLNFFYTIKKKYLLLSNVQNRYIFHGIISTLAN